MSKPIVPFDWQRLFFGEEPFGFMGEILFRSLFMYVCLLVLLRLLSKRALSQMSILEFALVIALGSAVGDPTFYQDVPLFHGLAVLITIVCFQLIYTWILTRNETVENLMEGVPRELVKDGVIQYDELQKARLSQGELFEGLRVAQMRQLGQVQRAYLEQTGQFSVIPFPQTRVGLAFVPPWDIVPPQALEPSTYATLGKQDLACLNCGRLYPADQNERACLNCGDTRRVLATLDPLQDS